MSETKLARSRTPRRRPGGPRRWSAADKTRYLTEFARSGLSIKSFCAKTGVPKATFNYWQREAREAKSVTRRHKTPGFAQVELVPPVASSGLTMVVRSPSGIATEVSGLDRAAVESLVQVILTTRSR
jgi:transposase-like protein